jgi:hypothetical protein
MSIHTENSQMSIPTQSPTDSIPSTSSSAPSSSPRPTKSVSLVMLLLSLGLAAVATAAIFLGVLNSRNSGPGGGGGGSGDGPLVQKETVSPQGQYTGIVFYPIPYASPPNLKLTSSTRQYDIIKQDESGFTWMARTMLDDFNEAQRQQAAAQLGTAFGQLQLTSWLKPNLQFEDFTWETKGVRPGADSMRAFEQTGKFNTVMGKEGEVNFPMPYALAPNVELSGGPSGGVIIVESRPTGFKWKNVGDNQVFHNGEVGWQTRGVRATEIPKTKTP